MNDGRKARGDARRALLLDAAVSVVAQGGASSLSHRAVASTAGVSLASVTYHFPSVDDLRRATFDYAGTRVNEEIERTTADLPSSPTGIAEAAGALAGRLCGEHREITLTAFHMLISAGHNAELRPTAESLFARAGLLFTRFLPAPQVDEAVSALHGAILVALARGGDASPWADATARGIVLRFLAPHNDAAAPSFEL